MTYPQGVYTVAWNELYKCFGERMQQDELDLMDAVLSGVALNMEDDTLQSAGGTSDCIKKLVDKKPIEYTQSDLAKLFGVSRQRINQIVTKLNLTDRFKKRHCRLCSGCGKAIDKQSKSGLCRKCYSKSKRTSYTCDNCGKIAEREIIDIKRYKHHFCSRRCMGAYAARYYIHGGIL